MTLTEILEMMEDTEQDCSSCRFAIGAGSTCGGECVQEQIEKLLLELEMLRAENARLTARCEMLLDAKVRLAARCERLRDDAKGGFNF